MMKLATIFKSRGNVSGQLLNRYNATQDLFGLHASMNCAGISTVGQQSFTNDRIFAAYSVYKGKAALSAEPVPPKFSTVNCGGMKVKRQGFILLSFSPSVGERKYDWQRKQVFALSATEVGSLIALGPTGSCEFFHDPAMQTSNAGQVRKSLSIRANTDGSGYFMSLSVNNSISKTNERFTVPVTSAEFAVMRTSFSFALPHIMGWDRLISQLPNPNEQNSMNAGLRSSNSMKAGQRSSNPMKAGPGSSNSEWDK
ncbi:single-stranded DNA-binding protein WHY2, mitochondrial [Beta vulgaris subsp. vulgaris]|uniref:single-stranded DNA-binding protein WHY2, mitochondrial n=1 Tax=Beta vulgaris subsp. vulgaris TaxID=3555 RepID=UPI002036ABB4|nr:single-stranded DNA-binding protein WHY2, mitochondrial [Beta vulgaris subsp. vulgaris]